jgi:hypothetical protein
MQVRHQLYTPPTLLPPPVPSGWVVPTASLDTFREGKNLFPLPRIERQIPSETACGVVTVLITMSELLMHMSDLYMRVTLYVPLTMQTG